MTWSMVRVRVWSQRAVSIWENGERARTAWLAFLGVRVGVGAGAALGAEAAGADLVDEVAPEGGLELAGGAAGGEDDRSARFGDPIEVSDDLVAVHPVVGRVHDGQRGGSDFHCHKNP
ncbi:hypothetical protein [Streptomyces sp. LaBMicrA B280]|uniref:hypothetical protein n=1 Tax=Streptomyces sp. LaBMicrA B280 TaxID=3391001 RepID=UPI003BA65EF2